MEDKFFCPEIQLIVPLCMYALLPVLDRSCRRKEIIFFVNSRKFNCELVLNEWWSFRCFAHTRWIISKIIFYPLLLILTFYGTKLKRSIKNFHRSFFSSQLLLQTINKFTRQIAIYIYEKKRGVIYDGITIRASKAWSTEMCLIGRNYGNQFRYRSRLIGEPSCI